MIYPPFLCTHYALAFTFSIMPPFIAHLPCNKSLYLYKCPSLFKLLLAKLSNIDTNLPIKSLLLKSQLLNSFRKRYIPYDRNSLLWSHKPIHLWLGRDTFGFLRFLLATVRSVLLPLSFRSWDPKRANNLPRFSLPVTSEVKFRVKCHWLQSPWSFFHVPFKHGIHIDEKPFYFSPTKSKPQIPKFLKSHFN